MSALTHLPSAVFSLIHGHNKCVFAHVSGKLLHVFVNAGQHVMVFFLSLSTADLMIFNIWNGITTVGNFPMDYRETGNPLIPSLCSAPRLTRCSYCEAQDKYLSFRLLQRSAISYRCACLCFFCCIISLVIFYSDGTNNAVREEWSDLLMLPPIKARKIKETLIRALSLFCRPNTFLWLKNRLRCC